MWQVSDSEFHELIDQAMSELPKEHIKPLKNVAILVEDYPSESQRINLKLSGYQTLLGLYEGVPLSKRQGTQKILPDKITLFKGPIESRVNNEAELKEQIKHTLWHEIAHYYGLDHDAIHSLE